MGMESFGGDKKSSVEDMLFTKAQEKNPDLTREAFDAARKEALAAADAEDKTFYEAAGSLTMEKPTPEELEEMKIKLES